DWQNTQFLHVFQEQLITGERAEEKTTVNPDLGFMESQLAAMVDLQQTSVFEEPFYIVVLERTNKGTVVHMWRLVIASQPDSAELTGSMMYVPDSHLIQDEDDGEERQGRSASMSAGDQLGDHAIPVQASHVVCTQDLPLPDGVEVVHAAPAAGHLSSASIYPACFAPYIVVTACSDSTIRFWKCKVDKTSKTAERSYEWCEWEMLRKDQESTIDITGQYSGSKSTFTQQAPRTRVSLCVSIAPTGQPLNISAGYSGRIACAYKYGKSFTRPSKNDPDSRYVNLCVAIYECESTGGSEWVLEDTIHLKNIHLPRIQVDPHLDLSYLYDNRFLQKKQRLNHLIQALSSEDVRSPKNGDIVNTGHSNELHPKSGTGLLAVPSFSTLQSLRKSIIECGNTCPLTQKHLVQLDWVSKEDGSHILTVAVGSKVMLFTPVSSDLAQANMKAMKESQTTNRPILRKASSLAAPQFVDEIRQGLNRNMNNLWMKLRKIDLLTADGLPPLPMQISWVRDGILVVGMDSEMHVYSQWKPDINKLRERGLALLHQESDEVQDTRNLRDEDLRTLAQLANARVVLSQTTEDGEIELSFKHFFFSVSLSSLCLGGSLMKSEIDTARLLTSHSGVYVGSCAIVQADQISSADYMTDYGLFEASRIACPVLPQYHPKQLMELLNSGKIRWVKAILAHLVRCISGTCSVRQGTFQSGTDEESLVRQRGWSRSRTLSVSYVGAGTTSPLEQRGSTTAIPEELTLDYAEITSIPPLPLWTLLAADKETTGISVQMCDDHQDYNELFNGTIGAGDQSLDDILEDEPNSPGRRHDRRPSVNNERQGLSHFGPRQGRLLSRLLTHTHLPGLSSLDQMHLLALADTVSTCNTDFAERFAIDAAKNAIAKENLSGMPEGEDMSTDSLDDCGLRFLMAMKHYNYLLRCLPIAQRTHFQRQGMGTNNVVWAFHSESEEELLGLIPSYAKGSPKWAVLKELGVGWWLRNHSLLKTCIEKVAKASYLVNEDPMDAAIFYLAMKKKSLVWGLYRSKRDERMTHFFANNFSEDRWRKAALKNAYALLGKQRFEHAAAFFLLAGALRDAIEVCLDKLEDFQLAMVIARLYEGELDSTPASLKRLLYEEILGCNKDGENQDLSRAHPDPFLRSMTLWILKDHTGSLNTLLQSNTGSMHPQYCDDEKGDGPAGESNIRLQYCDDDKGGGPAGESNIGLQYCDDDKGDGPAGESNIGLQYCDDDKGDGPAGESNIGPQYCDDEKGGGPAGESNIGPQYCDDEKGGGPAGESNIGPQYCDDDKGDGPAGESNIGPQYCDDDKGDGPAGESNIHLQYCDDDKGDEPAGESNIHLQYCDDDKGDGPAGESNIHLQYCDDDKGDGPAGESNIHLQYCDDDKGDGPAGESNIHLQYCDDDKGDGPAANPNVFNFYVYLRTHPLLIRQYIASTAQDKRKAHTVVLAGFSYGGDTKAANPDKQLMLEDSITPLERQLYFTTAHAHFKAGCPALALEVLSKLPGKVMDPTGEDSPSLLNSPTKARVQDLQIDTGILAWENDSTATAPSRSNGEYYTLYKDWSILYISG
ncbi:unnamed protein product, partial [Timema podura]|nr:unnamed protein product [Timema podura]